MKLKIKELRKRRDWTQRAVAERAGMAVSYYTEIELGKKQANARLLDLLAKVFEVPVHDLIVGEPSNPLSDAVSEFDGLTEAQQKIIRDLIALFQAMNATT